MPCPVLLWNVFQQSSEMDLCTNMHLSPRVHAPQMLCQDDAYESVVD